MTAQAINTYVLVLSNPEWDQAPGERAPVNSSISYTLLLQDDIVTLSTNTATTGSDVEGLLYVPSLLSTDPCSNITKQYVPQNVTRRANLPDSEFSLIAHAPWISPTCTKSYLASASHDGARAFIFYQPVSSTYEPPQPSDPTWGLGDGGQWKSANKYPVYAVPGAYGTQMMQQLSFYSGNLTEAPFGNLLAEQYDSRDYVRLYTTVNTSKAPKIPSLWVFLLIVLGMLLGVIFLSSFLMHLIQRRRRARLRRMIGTGEVDLEALGIKRLKVPQEVLDKLPLYTFVSDDREKATSIPPQSPSRLPLPQSPVSPSEFPQNQPADTVVPASPRSVVFFTPPGSPTEQIYSYKRSRPPSPSSRRSASQLSNTHSSQPQPTLAPSSPTKTSIPASQPMKLKQLTTSQPTCPICIDDFVNLETTVRQLPCGHIYHPECVDPFLRDYSSLCALCKGRVLPQGYCPAEVTNAMVRRERLVRRMREHVDIVGGNEIELGTAAANTTTNINTSMIDDARSMTDHIGGGGGGGGSHERLRRIRTWFGSVPVVPERRAPSRWHSHSRSSQRSSSLSLAAASPARTAIAARTPNMRQVSTPVSVQMSSIPEERRSAAPSAIAAAPLDVNALSIVPRPTAVIREPGMSRGEWARRRASALVGGRVEESGGGDAEGGEIADGGGGGAGVGGIRFDSGSGDEYTDCVSQK
ncbi:hypothetical protein MMC25_003437 [Agyrium rufum]|nr:hypothetical protein [Agyrium rufum]